MKKITIVGSIDELVECEFYLIMLGYNKPEEKWNNHMCSKGNDPDRIITDSDGSIEYHNHRGAESDITASMFIMLFYSSMSNLIKYLKIKR